MLDPPRRSLGDVWRESPAQERMSRSSAATDDACPPPGGSAQNEAHGHIRGPYIHGMHHLRRNRPASAACSDRVRLGRLGGRGVGTFEVSTSLIGLCRSRFPLTQRPPSASGCRFSSVGVVLLFVIGSGSGPSTGWGGKTKRYNLIHALSPSAAARGSGHCVLTSFFVPTGTSTASAEAFRLFSSCFVLVQAASPARAASRVQRNSLPSSQMRCMITPSRRASATFARAWPRRFTTCMAQALSHHHRVVRVSMTLAAS